MYLRRTKILLRNANLNLGMISPILIAAVYTYGVHLKLWSIKHCQ